MKRPVAKRRPAVAKSRRAAPATKTAPSPRLTSKLKTRAKSDEAKKDVRQAFIAAGRALLSEKDANDVSLRQIAATAGYSPGAIYQYFGDHRELLMAIREQDMLAAVIAFEEMAARQRDPEQRVREVFLGVARYWLANFDHFLVLFSLPPNRPPIKGSDGVPFGRSPVVVRSYSLYDRIVRDLFATYDAPPVAVKVAVDTLIAAVHGIISFPQHTRTMDWTDTMVMVEVAIDALLASWRQ